MAKNQQKTNMLDLLNKLLFIVLILPFLFEVVLGSMIYIATLWGILSIGAINLTTISQYIAVSSILVIVAITLLRFLFIMKQKSNVSRIINEVVIVAGVFVFIWIFYMPHGGPSNLDQCAFQAGISCITNRLSANNGRLTLQIGQGTGHQIRINGVVCTQNTSSDFSNKTFISYGYNKNITMESGSSAILATPGDGQRPWLNISCTDADGSIPQNINIGTIYNGKIYINYTEMDTNLTKIVFGIYSARYEQ